MRRGSEDVDRLVSRRALLRGGVGLGAALGLPALAGCGSTDGTGAIDPALPRARRIAYGSGPDHYGLLQLPRGRARGTVVLIHGGAWLAQYRADQLVRAAKALATQGLASWNIEYRRLGEGGGWPATFLDTAAALDRLGSLTRAEAGVVDPASLTHDVVLLGHSAGGQLALWAASRTAQTPGGTPRVPLRGAISLSGLDDLTLAARQPDFSREVLALMGGSPAAVPQRYALGDPALLRPSVPVVAVHGTADVTVALSQTTSYVDAARALGADVRRVDVPGDHFQLVNPDGPGWPRILGLVRGALAGS